MRALALELLGLRLHQFRIAYGFRGLGADQYGRYRAKLYKLNKGNTVARTRFRLLVVFDMLADFKICIGGVWG